MKIPKRKKRRYGTCLHVYDPAKDSPQCNSRIKRKDWEITEMPSHVWFAQQWRCWRCKATIVSMAAQCRANECIGRARLAKSVGLP